jgi:hypothetical protein
VNTEFGPAFARFFGLLAMAGGLTRIATTFLVNWSAGLPQTEALALAIDFALLFGLTGFYFIDAARLGPLGLVGYLIAASGIAFIFGPDGTAFGRDIYETGVTAIGIGLIILSMAMLLAGVARLAGALWIASAAASVLGGAIGRGAEGFLFAGVLFGAGFVVAGLSLLRR